MTSTTMQLIDACKDDPSLIFTYIKEEKYRGVAELVVGNIVNINTVDHMGNDVVTRLLKAKQYELVMILMKKKNWDVNKQNDLGDTFGHILALDNSPMAIKVADELIKKSNYLPNIKNNNNQTVLDLALNNNHLCMAFKILEDKRFTNIDMFEFKNLFNVTVRNKLYGKYSKITNLEIIVNSLGKKDLEKELKNLIKYIKENMESIKQSILNNRFNILDSIINEELVVI